MNNADDMDLESMINNPFQYIDSEDESDTDMQYPQERGKTGAGTIPPPGASGPGKAQPSEQMSTGVNVDRINKNHPIELRMLNLEKNQLNWDKKVEMLKEIVEHQNERIDLLEKELDLYRIKSEEQN